MGDLADILEGMGLVETQGECSLCHRKVFPSRFKKHLKTKHYETWLEHFPPKPRQWWQFWRRRPGFSR